MSRTTIAGTVNESGKIAGLIGAGLLGTAIAQRLLQAGFHVVGFDISEERRKALTDLGCEAVRSSAEVVRRSERTVICLPDSEVTAAVLKDMLPVLQPGSLIIDVTTGSPEEMEGFGGLLSSHGVAYVDATIAGSSRQVLAGEASVMAGGEPASVSNAREILDALGPECFHVGPRGAAARMKLIVNMVLGLNRAVLAEGLAFAEACGVDSALALRVLKGSPAYSRAMDVKGAKMLSGDFSPDARLRQHRKDVRLMIAESERNGARVELTRTHEQLLSEAEQAGYGDSDNSAIIELLRKSVTGRKSQG